MIHSPSPPLIKVADWGVAAFSPPGLQLETSCGSPHYASPGIVKGMKYQGNATDIWSCGVILYALLTVKTGVYEILAYIDPMARDLLTCMLVVDVKQRIAIPEILGYPWFDEKTPGIVYVPAPSVTEPAKSLASEVHIDDELLESLCVSWGKHADVEGIKADLLKQTLKDRGIILEVDGAQVSLSGKIITKPYRSPSQKRSNGLELDTLLRFRRLHTSRDAPPLPSRSPSPAVDVPSPTSVTRSRALSPYSQAPTRQFTLPTSPEDAHQSGRGQENKGNSERYEGRYAYQEDDSISVAGGFAKPRGGGRVGRELRNIPPLDLHPSTLNTKRPVLSSPTQPTPPGMPYILLSPVGEFKGWFSNLFNWRAHTYVLCSTNNLAVTRIETVRTLEQLGVSIALEDPDGNASTTASILRCRTNEIVDGATGAVVQKHVRFRVEFSVGSAQVGGFPAPTVGAGSSTSTGASITVSAGVGTSSLPSSAMMSPRHASALGKQAMAVGYACAIVLVQEKGSLSTFRAVCRWLREEWTLDALQSPPGGGSGGQGVFLEQQQ
ncbi:hypothetical protein OG21DRAFT_1488529 [Imleria badia]|nr:hypothetical protein OG21DRAFT_1488529 [Imleria badia]